MSKKNQHLNQLITSALTGELYSKSSASHRTSIFQNNAKSWLEGVVTKHLPRTARTYKFRTLAFMGLQKSIFGFYSYCPGFEGKLIEVNGDMLLFKTGREFIVVERQLIKDASNMDGKIGRKFKVEPYVSKYIDGHPSNEPRKTGEGSSIFTIGGSPKVTMGSVELKIESSYIKELLSQLNDLVMPDCMRTLSEALIDAGLTEDGIEIHDVSDEMCGESEPGVTLTLSNMKLTIGYDVGMDTYTLYKDGELILDGSDNFTFADIGTALSILIDDKDWMYAKVNEAKKLKKVA